MSGKSQGNLKFLQGQRNVREFQKFVGEILKSENIRKKFISSPEPKAPGELIVKTVICRPSGASSVFSVSSTFSNDFSSETAGPFSIKFHIQHPDNGKLKICSNGPGLMAKMATMPIYSKNLKKSSAEPLA